MPRPKMTQTQLALSQSSPTIESITQEIRILLEARRRQLQTDADRVSAILQSVANVEPAVLPERRKPGRPRKVA